MVWEDTCNVDYKIISILFCFCYFACLFFLFFVFVCFFCFSRQCFSVQPWLSWNSLCRPSWPPTQKSACFCLLSAGIKGVCHHTQLFFLFLKMKIFLKSCYSYIFYIFQFSTFFIFVIKISFLLFHLLPPITLIYINYPTH